MLQILLQGTCGIIIFSFVLHKLICLIADYIEKELDKYD